MSGEIVNLRQARKQKQRQTKEKTAESNRQKFGRTKAERDIGTSKHNRIHERGSQQKCDPHR